MDNSLRSSFAPLTPDGPLPEGLTPQRLKSCFKKSIRFNLRDTLDALGAGGSRQPPEVQLRLLLDRRDGRERFAEAVSPLHSFLYYCLLKMHGQGCAVFDRLIKPALRTELNNDGGELVFLRPEEFRRLLHDPGLPDGFEADSFPFSPGSEAEFLGLYALAFGLLQPGDAVAIVGALCDAREAYRPFFGIAPEAPVDEAEGEAADTVGPTPARSVASDPEMAPCAGPCSADGLDEAGQALADLDRALNACAAVATDFRSFRGAGCGFEREFQSAFDVLKAAYGRARQAIGPFRESLPDRCQLPVETVAFCRAIVDRMAEDSTAAGAILDCHPQFRELSRLHLQLNESCETTAADLHRLESDLRILDPALVSEATSGEAKTLPELQSALERHQELTRRLRENLERQLAQSIERLGAAVGEASARPGLSDELLARVSALETRLLARPDAASIAGIERDLQTLQTDIEQAGNRLATAPDESPTTDPLSARRLLAIAARLSRQARHPESLLLLLMMQRNGSFIDSDLIEDAAPFVETLMIGLAGAIRQQPEGAGLLLADLLLNAEWLCDLVPEDIRDGNVRLCLQTLILAASAQDRDVQHLLAHGLNVFDAFEADSAPGLAAIARAMLQQTPWTVPEVSPSSLIAAVERDVEESLDRMFEPTLRKNPKLRDAALRMRETVRAAWDRAQRLPAADARRELDETEKAVLREIGRETQKCDSSTFFKSEMSSELAAACETTRRQLPLIAEARNAVVPTGRDGLAREIDLVAGHNPDLEPVWDLIGQTLIAGPLQRQKGLKRRDLAYEKLFLFFPGIIALLPEESARQCGFGAGTEEDPAGILELMIARLEKPPEPSDVASRLKIGEALLQLEIVVDAFPDGYASVTDPGPDRRSRQSALRATLERLSGALSSTQQHQYEWWIAEGRLARVARQFELIEAEQRRQIERELAGLNDTLREQRKRLREMQDSLDDRSWPSEWREMVHGCAGRLIGVCADALQSQRTVDERRLAVRAIADGLTVLDVYTRYGHQDLTALRQACDRTDAYRSVAPGDGPAGEEGTELQLPTDLSEQARKTRLETWYEFLLLGSSTVTNDPAMQQQSIDALTRSFAGCSRMYCNERDPEERFHRSAIPGIDIRPWITRFHRSRQAFFDRDLRIICLPGTHFDRPQATAIREYLAIPKEESRLNLALVPAEAEKAERFFQHEVALGRVVVIGPHQLRSLLEARRPEVPLRYRLRRVAGLEVASPFVWEGHVDMNANIFVGRTDRLTRLVNMGCHAIWGGRRIGKTSLLHAVRQKLLQNRGGRVTALYETLETLQTDDAADIDMRVACKIARGLEWDAMPASLEEFKHRLQKQCEGMPVCLLLDEVDAYIRPHIESGDGRYAVIRHLRSVRNAVGDRFSCIFSGFKYLYQIMEVERRPDDPSFPWQNWLTTADPLSRLTSDETARLVDEGFTEMGLEYDETVPLLIYQYTAGHPAFVQYFCQSILRRLKVLGRQNEPRITESEVRAIFNADTSEPDWLPYIRFVEKTLDMNLGELEKIIMYIIAAQCIGKSGDPYSWLQKSRIGTEVNGWIEGCGRKARTQAEMKTAFGFLEMTGMIETGAVGSQCRLSFKAYADILQRLEETDKDRIEDLIQRLSGRGQP